jgi:hypothetical protein
MEVILSRESGVAGGGDDKGSSRPDASVTNGAPLDYLAAAHNAVIEANLPRTANGFRCLRRSYFAFIAFVASQSSPGGVSRK